MPCRSHFYLVLLCEQHFDGGSELWVKNRNYGMVFSGFRRRTLLGSLIRLEKPKLTSMDNASSFIFLPLNKIHKNLYLARRCQRRYCLKKLRTDDRLIQGTPKGCPNKSYHKLRKAYLSAAFCLSKYNVELKTLLMQGLSEPEFYSDLVDKFRK